MIRSFPHMIRPIVTALAALTIAACGTPSPPASGPNPATAVITPATPTPSAPSETTFENGRSITLAAAPDGGVYALVGRDRALMIARSRTESAGFAEPVRATGDVPALVSPIERPALTVDRAGRLAVSWLEQRSDGQTAVWLSRSADGGRSFAALTQLASTTAHETTMISTAFTEQTALATWLEDGALMLARSGGEDGGSVVAARAIDDEVCECCQPDPLVQGQRVLIAFRNLAHDGADDLRDIHVIVSEDGGATFGESVPISDESWRINACPISGPALAASGDVVYAAWMDGRADRAKTGDRGDVWLARSEDGGRTWSANARVNQQPQHLHTMPALAIDASGRLHVAWETHTPERTTIVYSTSDDQGATFAAPRTIVSSDAAGRGTPASPSLAIDTAGQVHLAWVDRLGAHVQTWQP